MSEIELADAILRNSIAIMRLAAGEQAEAERILRELETELKALLQSRALSEATKAQVEALIREAGDAIDARYATVAGNLDTHALAVVVAEKTVDILGDAVPVNFDMPTEARLASLSKDVLIDGAPSSAWWGKQAEDTAFKFAGQVRQGVINGETNERIVQRIVGKGGEPGIMTIAKRNARTLVHSSVMTAANQARLATFRKNADTIKGVRWLATLDGHTCIRCAALDGMSWDLDGEPLPGTTLPFEAPPIHFADRCVLSPITKTFRDLGIDIDEPNDVGQRASSQGPVAGSTTFDQFFARQTREQQDEQFGPERAQMFRDGKITVRDLVSGTGRELTLDEIRANH